jgi:hypothetical protein
VIEDGIETDPNTFEFYYWVIIRNDCSDNNKKFYLAQGDWYNATVGDPFCITDIDSWMVSNEDDLIPVLKENYSKTQIKR